MVCQVRSDSSRLAAKSPGGCARCAELNRPSCSIHLTTREDEPKSRGKPKRKRFVPTAQSSQNAVTTPSAPVKLTAFGAVRARKTETWSRRANAEATVGNASHRGRGITHATGRALATVPALRRVTAVDAACLRPPRSSHLGCAARVVTGSHHRRRPAFVHAGGLRFRCFIQRFGDPGQHCRGRQNLRYTRYFGAFYAGWLQLWICRRALILSSGST